jgi:hypothetical protein
MPTPIGVFSLDDIKNGRVNPADLNIGGSNPTPPKNIKGKGQKPQRKDEEEEEGL